MNKIFLLLLIFVSMWCCVTEELRAGFIPIEAEPYTIDTISVVNPTTYKVSYYETKISDLFSDGILETHRDTIEKGNVVRSFGEKDSSIYQLLEIRLIKD